MEDITKQESEQQDVIIDLSDQENVRQAIIAAEIINRKY